MNEFEALSRSEGLQPIYQKVVSEIGITEHPDFASRHVKILDMGGGVGMVGVHLKQQCETVFGPLSPEEFALLVDYVNIDIDNKALKKSPGRSVNMDIAHSSTYFQDEGPFDFVLSVDPSPQVHQYTTKELNKLGIPKDWSNPLQGILKDSSNQIRGYISRIALLNAALLLREGGKYIWTGFISRESFEGTTAYIRKNGLGLKVEKDETLALTGVAREQFAAFDTGKRKGRIFERAKALYDTYRLLVMRASGVSDKVKLETLLKKEIDEYGQWSNFCETQERFWT